MQTNQHHQTKPQIRPIDVVRAAYDAYARRDLARIVALYHPQCVLEQTEDLPWGGTYHGHLGLQQFFERLTAAIDTRIVDERLFEAGDKVVSIGRTQGTARSTGQAFALDAVHVYTVEEGMIRRYEAYVDTPGMRAAVC